MRPVHGWQRGRSDTDFFWTIVALLVLLAVGLWLDLHPLVMVFSALFIVMSPQKRRPR